MNKIKKYKIKKYKYETREIKYYEYIAISIWSAFDSVIMPNRSDSQICRLKKCIEQDKCDCNKIPIKGFFQPTEFTLALKKKINKKKIIYEKVDEYSNNYPEDYSEILNFPYLENNSNYNGELYQNDLEMFIKEGYIPILISKCDLTFVFRQDALDLFLENPANYDTNGIIIFARSKKDIPINNINEKYNHPVNIEKMLKNSPFPFEEEEDEWFLESGCYLLKEQDARNIFNIMRHFICDDCYRYQYNYCCKSVKNVLFIGADAGCC